MDESIPERVDYLDFFRTFAGCAATNKSVEPSPCVAYDCPIRSGRSNFATT